MSVLAFAKSSLRSMSSMNVYRSPYEYDTTEIDTGFEELKRYSKLSSELFKEVISVLEERSHLEVNYSKNLHKLSSRLMRASKDVLCSLDETWRTVAEEMESIANVHKNLGNALMEEIVTPLRTVCDSQVKTKRSTEGAVDKAAKKLSEKRSEQLKAKRKAHGLSRETEKTYKITTEEQSRSIHLMTDKQLAKLQAKRMKLEESAAKADQQYHDITIIAERQREDLENVILNAADKLEKCEEQRLANLQTALGRYQRNMSNVGPKVLQILQEKSVDSATSVSVADEMKIITTKYRSNHLSSRVLLLCDFHAEDFSLEMTPIRRREALERHILTFRKDVEREQRGKEGLEHLSQVYAATPKYATEESSFTLRDKLKDTCLMLNFLHFNLYKIQMSMSVLSGVHGEPHRLSKYMEKYKDKTGLRQTILKVPLFACSDLDTVPSDPQHSVASVATTSANSTLQKGIAPPPPKVPRESGDGQSPTSDSERLEPAYEVVDPVAYTKSVTCKVLYDFNAERPDEISIRQGDVITGVTKNPHGWWEGTLDGKRGLFPATYTEEISEDNT